MSSHLPHTDSCEQQACPTAAISLIDSSVVDHSEPSAEGPVIRTSDGRPVHLLDLPADLLGLVLTKAGKEEGHGAAQACKRLHHAYWAEAALWRELRVVAGEDVAALDNSALAEWAERKACLVRRVGSMVETLSVTGELPAEEVVRAGGSCSTSGRPTGAQWARLGWRLTGLLAAVAGSPCLRQLDVRVWELRASWSEVCALGTLGGLEILVLGPPVMAHTAGLCRLPSSATAALLQLSGTLRQLSLGVRAVPLHTLCAVLGLTRLTSLALASHDPLPAATSCLSALSSLEALELHECTSVGTGLCLPSQAFLQQLADLDFSAPRVQLSAGHGGALLNSIAEADAEAYIWVSVHKCPCCQHRTLTVRNLSMPQSAGLHSLLSGTGAAGGRLNRLVLGACRLFGPAMGAANPAARAELGALLGEVQSLEVVGCDAVEAEGCAPALRRLLAQLPALTNLAVRGTNVHVGHVSRMLGAIPADAPLTQLELSHCIVGRLPDGAYLSALQELSLVDNDVTALWPALAGAGRLTKLSLASNPRLDLGNDDVDALLGLPSLERLELWHTAAAEQRDVLQPLLTERLPHVTVVWDAPLDGESDS